MGEHSFNLALFCSFVDSLVSFCFTARSGCARKIFNVCFLLTLLPDDIHWLLWAQDVVETGTPRHMADEENVDDAYTKARGSLAGLFVTDIFHDIETEELFSQVRGYTVDEFANLLSQE